MYLLLKNTRTNKGKESKHHKEKKYMSKSQFKKLSKRYSSSNNNRKLNSTISWKKATSKQNKIFLHQATAQKKYRIEWLEDRVISKRNEHYNN